MISGRKEKKKNKTTVERVDPVLEHPDLDHCTFYYSSTYSDVKRQIIFHCHSAVGKFKKARDILNINTLGPMSSYINSFRRDRLLINRFGCCGKCK